MPKSRSRNSSSTPGKVKQSNCHKSVLKNQYVHDTKWYRKNPIEYAKACEHINEFKGNSKSAWTKEVLK